MPFDHTPRLRSASRGLRGCPHASTAASVGYRECHVRHRHLVLVSLSVSNISTRHLSPELSSSRVPCVERKALVPISTKNSPWCCSPVSCCVLGTGLRPSLGCSHVQDVPRAPRERASAAVAGSRRNAKWGRHGHFCVNGPAEGVKFTSPSPHHPNATGRHRFPWSDTRSQCAQHARDYLVPCTLALTPMERPSPCWGPPPPTSAAAAPPPSPCLPPSPAVCTRHQCQCLDARAHRGGDAVLARRRFLSYT